MLKDFNVTDYKIIKKIGQGSFGQIFMVKDEYNRKYALKKIIGSSEKRNKKFKTRISNIIRYSIKPL